MSDEMRGAGAPQGLSWSWELDFDALMESLGETGPRGPGNSGPAPSGTSRSGTSAARASADPAAADPAFADPVSAAADPAFADPVSAAADPASASPASAGFVSADPAADPTSAGPVSADPASARARSSGRPSDDGFDAAEVAQEEALDDLDDGAECDGERIPAWALAGRVAERLAPGPDLAAWLAMAPAGSLADGDLAAVAGSWRRVASWAQARELAAVAQIASRAAAREPDIETGADGRPARIPAAAAAEVAMELTMSQYGAAGWADLAVALQWRLAGTLAALTAGEIDLYRARLIAEATSMLTDEAARAVEEKVLPAAGDQTPGMLRAALRRAVIAADPRGAEERRKESERRAKVVLYPDEEHTATLAGQRLPAIHAAAAMARIKAMARALKASGAGGGMDRLCAQIYLGLLLGTLPLIPPAEGAPPGDGPGDEPGEDPPDDAGGDLAGEDPGPSPGGPGGSPGRGPGKDPGGGPSGGNPDGDPAGRAGQGQPPNGRRGASRTDASASRDAWREDAPREDAPREDAPREDAPRGGDLGEDGLGDDVPPPGDQDAPRDDDYACPDDGPAGSGWAGPGQGHDDDGRPAGDWPDLPGLPPVIPPALTRPGDARPGEEQPGERPAAGLLDVSLPWQVLAGTSAAPGHLGRIGPVTASQARQLAGCAARDPAAEWRIIVTTPDGHALAVTRIPRPRPRGRGRDGPAASRPPPGAGIGLVGRVTLIIPEDNLTHPPLPAPRASPAPGPTSAIVRLALRAAGKAATRARAAAAADAAAGGCAHTCASPGYRPPPRLHDYITARDLTCRSPICRQPAWRGDLDHTIPYDDGGLTCRCNLGGVCRTHHVLKHHPAWKLQQTAPGIFTWTTPSGRTFTVTPDTHPL